MTNDNNINDIEVIDPIDVSAPKAQYTSQDLYEKYIVHVGTGTAFQVLPRDAAFVYLAGGPKLMTAPIVKLIQFLEEGVWRFAYPGEALNQRPEPTQEQINHKHKVLKALMYFQLAMEANDDLKGSLDHNKYLDNVLRKAVKELERYAAKDIKNVYGADPQLITNVFNAMDKSVDKMVEFLPHEYFFIEMVLNDYIADPAKIQERPVAIQKLDTEIEE